MCLKEFCSCWSPPVEGEGSTDRRPQRDYSSPKLKPTKSFDPPKKTLGVNDSAAAATTPPPPPPLKGNSNGAGLKLYSPPPKETPVVSKLIEKVTAAAQHKPTDGEIKADTTTTTTTTTTREKSTSEDVHPSSLMYHDSEEALPKGGHVPKNSSANHVTDATEQQLPTKIEHESIAPTGDFTGQTRGS